MQPKQKELIRPLRLAAIILSAVAIGASTTARAQPKSIDSAYKGSLECEPMTAGSEIFRTPLSIIVRNGWLTALFDHDDGRPPSTAFARVTVDPVGVFRFGYTLYTRDYSIRGNYSGTLNATRLLRVRR